MLGCSARHRVWAKQGGVEASQPMPRLRMRTIPHDNPAVLSLFAAAVHHLHSLGNQVAQNATAFMDENDHCVCTVVLPNEPFPVQQMEALEMTAKELNDSVKEEMQKIKDFEKNLDWCMEKMKTLTKEIDGLKAPAKPETAELVAEVPFEHLKDELVELEVLVQALVSTLNGSNSSVVNLYEEVQNISNMVSQLESFDKNKLLQLRREMESLKERLQDCEKSPKQPAEPAEVPYGNCEHSGLAHIGKPTLVQLNWKGSSHKYGGWGKDTAFPPARKNLYWVAPLNMDGRILEAFRTYSSYNDLLLYRSPTEKQLSIYKKSTGRWNHTNGGQGAGMIIHGDYFYYNCYNSADMCRYNLKTGVVERKTLLNAMNNIRFTYSHVTYQYLDFASDEHGLWVMYATEDSAGKIVISKLDVTSFSVVKSWTTTEYKPLVTNAFMICGVMYAVRPLGSNKEEIFYRYDTKTGQEEQMSLVMETLMDTVQSMNYNPNEHRIYIFNDGYQMYYETNFAH